MKRKLLGILITLNVLAPFVHADEPFSIPASAVNTQAFDEPPDSAEAMNIVTNAVKQVPGTVAINQPPIDSNQPPVNSNRPTTALPAAPRTFTSECFFTSGSVNDRFPVEQYPF